ncbi:MAG: metalloregulator ArsR/SmtB family transcription factor [Clostridia bacterium]|nr:metalloregulator ArsR/SmtB family transcription factor [Clostridia bacterium]
MHDHALMCDCDVIHDDAVKRTLQNIEDTDTLFAVSDFLKVMGDSTRMRILAALDTGELCVCDLSAVLDMSKSAISHQLKTLKDACLVKFRREGKNVYYSLEDEHVSTIIEMGIEHVKEKAGELS